MVVKPIIQLEVAKYDDVNQAIVDGDARGAGVRKVLKNLTNVITFGKMMK